MLTDKKAFKAAFIEKLQTMQSTSLEEATTLDRYTVLASLVMENINKKWVQSKQLAKSVPHKEVFYFSLEFMVGRMLDTNLRNLAWAEQWQEALGELGIDLAELENWEPDPGLGNGGLGRLAACFMDSLASLGYVGNGCGIRYKYGLFEQKIVNGYQVELPDEWLKEGNVWESRRTDKTVEVRFGGRVEVEEERGSLVFQHRDYEPVRAIPYDVPVLGFRKNWVNTLRLWKADAAKAVFDFASFSGGDYLKAGEYRSSVEAITQVLYPDDRTIKGRELRLKQQYFLVSAGVQSIIRHHLKVGGTLDQLAERIAIHINDTHPALVIPELMRVLMDDHRLGWDEAWNLTTNIVAYTNHTIMAEALEKWPVVMFKQLLPRIYMIIHEINERFCRELWEQNPGDWERIHHLAIIADDYVKMAHLAIVGSHSVNGVSAIHTLILKEKEMAGFHLYYPGKFSNKTNGITHRRWLLKANPRLADLISATIGTEWIYDHTKLSEFSGYAGDSGLQEAVARIKAYNKIRLAKLIKEQQGIIVDEQSIFDVQVKRLHAYKRQLLNVFNIMNLYNMLVEGNCPDIVPRTFIFGGKAAPSYYQAKNTIKLINAVAEKVNNDPRVRDKIRVVFLENYRVALAEKIFPAAEVSEQLSTASKEASGTGNMKFMLNGAITIGTRDGANIEIGEAVGEENIVFFGLTAGQVLDYNHRGGYFASNLYNEDYRIRLLVDQLTNGFLSDKSDFVNIHDSLLVENDQYFVLKDFAAYVDAQAQVDQLYRDRSNWQRMSIINIGQAGRFFSDRTITEYAEEIWGIKPLL